MHFISSELTIILITNLHLDCTYWIDVCSNDGNLLATGGNDGNIKIYDRRSSSIVKTFEVHTSKLYFLFFTNDSDRTNISILL